MSAGTRRRGEKDEIQLQHQALLEDWQEEHTLPAKEKPIFMEWSAAHLVAA